MYDQLDAFIIRYEELSELLSDPEVLADTKRFLELTKEEAGLREKVATFKRYKEVESEIADTEELLSEKLDDDMAAMAKEELNDLKKEKTELEGRIKVLLLPTDPNDDKNIIMEIRGAAGGDEAALFAGTLFTMYSKYAESQGWRVEVMDANITGIGGYKEIILMISGNGAYSKLKYESGAHRVQRVPETESQGRVHTSTATVVVLPEAEEVELVIEDKDIRTDIYHASGAGGQHVNKTASAVRLTHLPTGIAVAMQDERSQIKNREKAMKVLRTRVYDKLSSEAQSEYDATRKSAVGTGDRSERIRTYNFPQNRVTDHRIGLTLQKLDTILNGKLDEIIDALIMADQTQKLESLNNGGI
jgi:peptide chain release factor 1